MVLLLPALANVMPKCSYFSCLSYSYSYCAAVADIHTGMSTSIRASPYCIGCSTFPQCYFSIISTHFQCFCVIKVEQWDLCIDCVLTRSVILVQWDLCRQYCWSWKEAKERWRLFVKRSSTTFQLSLLVDQAELLIFSTTLQRTDSCTLFFVKTRDVILDQWPLSIRLLMDFSHCLVKN